MPDTFPTVRTLPSDPSSGRHCGYLEKKLQQNFIPNPKNYCKCFKSVQLRQSRDSIGDIFREMNVSSQVIVSKVTKVSIATVTVSSSFC